MELVQVQVAVPKEANDIKILLVALVASIKAKKSLGEITADVLPKLMSAIEGFDKLGEEAKSQEMINLYGLLAADIAKVLAAPAPAAEVAG